MRRQMLTGSLRGPLMGRLLETRVALHGPADGMATQAC